MTIFRSVAKSHPHAESWRQEHALSHQWRSAGSAILAVGLLNSGVVSHEVV